MNEWSNPDAISGVIYAAAALVTALGSVFGVRAWQRSRRPPPPSVIPPVRPGRPKLPQIPSMPPWGSLEPGPFNDPEDKPTRPTKRKE